MPNVPRLRISSSGMATVAGGITVSSGGITADGGMALNSGDISVNAGALFFSTVSPTGAPGANRIVIYNKNGVPYYRSGTSADEFALSASSLSSFSSASNTWTGLQTFNNAVFNGTLALGTPTSGTLTNATGLPLSTGVTGTLPVANGGTGITSLGSGVATFLGTPSSANLLAAVTDETGTGALVFATSPTLVTPVLGTPTSGTLTNATGLPLSTGVTGTLPVANGGTGITSLGSGVATFLGTPSSANLLAAVTDETGTGALVFATSPTFVTPVLGTPTSGTLTNATGLPLSTGVTGTLPVANGGTGITSLGSGVATFLGTPSSANLLAAVTDETGTGALVFSTSPTFTTAMDSGATFTAFASATTLTVGYTGTTASTTNISTGAVAASTTKTVNIGTGGVTSSTTNVSIGSAAGGLVTVNSSLTVTGDLTVNGTTTTINSTTLSVDDKNIELASIASPTDTTADGAGITVKGASDKTLNWVSTTAAWTSSENFDLAAAKTYKIGAANVLSSSTLSLIGNAYTSTLVANASQTAARAFSLPLLAGTLIGTGDTGTVSSTMLASTVALRADTHYIGTTAVTLNRATAALALTGITSVSFPSGATSQYTTVLQGSASATANATYTLPVADGTNGQTLVTNGGGTLSWATASGGASGTTTNSLSAGTGLTWTTGTTFNGSAASTLAIDSTVALKADTHYIGTTAVTLNRATAALALTGITSISFPSNSTTTTLQGSASATGATAYYLPASLPTTSGYVLTSTTGGVMSWAAVSGGASGTTTYSLSAGTGLTWTTGTTFNGSAASTLAIDSTVALKADTHYIGTTAVTLNRATAALALTGITSVSFPSGSTSQYTTVLQGSASATANATYTLPVADGTNGQTLVTNGGGTLSWAAVSGGASVVQTKTYTIPGSITASTGTVRWYPDASITVTGAYVSVATAPSGSSAQFSIKKTTAAAVTTTLATISVSAGAYKSSISSFSSLITTEDYVTIDVISSGNASTASVTITYTRN